MGAALVAKHIAPRGDKGNAVLAMYFIRGGMLVIPYQQQGGAFQL